jgi:hypothetical protein
MVQERERSGLDRGRRAGKGSHKPPSHHRSFKEALEVVTRHALGRNYHKITRLKGRDAPLERATVAERAFERAGPYLVPLVGGEGGTCQRPLRQ